MYSSTYMKHFSSPKNVGIVEDSNISVEVVNEEEGCFDTVLFTAKLENNMVVDAKYKLKACSGTIVTFSLFTEMIKGKNLEFIKKIDYATINDELGGIPEKKAHSIRLVLEARDKMLKEKL